MVLNRSFQDSFAEISLGRRIYRGRQDGNSVPLLARSSEFSHQVYIFHQVPASETAYSFKGFFFAKKPLIAVWKLKQCGP